MSDGKRIIDGLKDALAGNFARVTIEGQTWERVKRNDHDPPSEQEVEHLAAQIERLRAIQAEMRTTNLALKDALDEITMERNRLRAALREIVRIGIEDPDDAVRVARVALQ